MVKGGTVSDVLDNIPSVTVDSDGAVSLRGNANVRILVDGKPSNAINIAEALRQIPADAIDKVEVVTNPSARYDSEGGGGLLNIILKKGKNKGLNITCSVAAHHLVLNDDELASFDGNTKVLPPLRTSKDIKALIKGINEGVIDMITSDHNPMDIEHKKVEYSNAKFGTIGLESLFGALNKVISIETLITCLTTNPRNRFNIENSLINEGEKANLTLFNPDFEYEFSLNNITSTSKNSVFLNKKLNGKVYGVISNNKVVL